MQTEIVNAAVARWTDPARRPLFKGKLIDDDGCCCAQGDILRCELNWSDRQLRDADQTKVDRLIAKTLGISVAHSIFLRQINDSQNGCPQDVLMNPEKILGPMTQEVLRFWCHIDAMTEQQWAAARDAAWAAARAAARDAARDAARAAARDAAEAAGWAAARDAARDAAEAAAWAAARAAARDAARAAAEAAGWAAAWATGEIMGAKVLAAEGIKPFFLPFFDWVVETIT